MGKVVRVKGITIGEGAPKICVPLVGETLEQLKVEAGSLQSLEFDIVEWRVDFFEYVENIEKVVIALREIRSIIPDVPLIFTFRSAKEGGEKEVSPDFYVALNTAIVETSLVEIIDVELFHDEMNVKKLVEVAHIHGVYVIISNHDFDKTPPKEEIVSRLRKAQEMGGDLPKIAVMPNETMDVLTLLEATLIMKEQYADRPIITMSMGSKGVISRVAGEVFGSALTFGAINKASAPGQLHVSELRHVLTVLHKS
ncbi:type I 3-dehydroquinate dehydratase [Brevibacillus daliensis]|uniref:type I 3-dehydroquinate dehydratase n=1 Tax=Brevibacillus daliensis TaxID=2892995 RepID=UPI001E5CEB4C|nr:type I 3-dehydroquinate dehydratase [Brevibacillus daliensis]